MWQCVVDERFCKPLLPEQAETLLGSHGGLLDIRIMCEGVRRFPFQAFKPEFSCAARVFNSFCGNTKTRLRAQFDARVTQHGLSETQCHDQESRNKIPYPRDGEHHNVNH